MQPYRDDPQDFPNGYYWYASRWFDDGDIPHYFGIRSEHATIVEAQRNAKFNVIAVPPDLVYGPCDVDSLSDFMADVLAIPFDDDDPDNLGDVGTLGWI